MEKQDLLVREASAFLRRSLWAGAPMRGWAPPREGARESGTKPPFSCIRQRIPWALGAPGGRPVHPSAACSILVHWAIRATWPDL